MNTSDYPENIHEATGAPIVPLVAYSPHHVVLIAPGYAGNAVINKGGPTLNGARSVYNNSPGIEVSDTEDFTTAVIAGCDQ